MAVKHKDIFPVSLAWPSSYT